MRCGVTRRPGGQPSITLAKRVTLPDRSTRYYVEASLPASNRMRLIVEIAGGESVILALMEYRDGHPFRDMPILWWIGSGE